MAKQTTAGNIVKKTVRVPLVGNAQQRSTTLDKDQRFVNCMVETSTNKVTDTKKLFLVKRPGTELYSEVVGAPAEGRGCWSFNNHIYSIYDDKLYEDDVEIQTLSTSTGMCGGVDFIDTYNFSKKALFIADGIDAWIIDDTGTVTQVDTVYLQWSGNTTVEAGDRRINSTLTHWFTCTTSGITGSTEPVWDTDTGDSTTDNEAVWRCEGTYSGPAKFQTSHAYSVGDKIIPTTESGYYYEVTIAGTSGTEPEWTLILGDITVSGTVSFECKGQYGGFPTPHIASPSYIDGYVLLAKQNSNEIYNSDITRPTSWGALNFYEVSIFSDYTVGLARQNNFVCAFGTSSTEFLYNSAKVNTLDTFDTPLDRHETSVLQVGALHKDAIFSSEKTIIFIGSSEIGGHSVWRVDGTSSKEISTEYIEKYIDLESSTSNITGYGIRVGGHMLFIMNLPTAQKTFVYDIEEQMWVEWEYSNTYLPFVDFCDNAGSVILQHGTNGNLYSMSIEVFKDFDSNIDFLVRLGKQDFDTDNNKFFHKSVIVGDKVEGDIYLRWSDNDYDSWSQYKQLTSGTRPYYMRSGNARRRAWEISHSSNYRLRLEALELLYSIGEH